MKRKVACFTLVQNEPFFPPKWLDYYSKHFDSNDLYVLDHDSNDGSVLKHWHDDDFGNIIPIHRKESFNHLWLRETVEAFQRFLLQSYECVLFTEVDEYVAAEHGLVWFIDAFMESSSSAVRCRGVDVVEGGRGINSPPTLRKPWLLENSLEFWENRWYDKVLLSKIPITWTNGFHTAAPGIVTSKDPVLSSSQLWLIHCHRINYQYCRDKHEETAVRKWSTLDVQLGSGSHNRMTGEAFDKWFHESDKVKPIEVPHSIKVQV